MIETILVGTVLGITLYFVLAWFPWIVIDWVKQRKFKRAKKHASEEDEWIFEI